MHALTDGARWGAAGTGALVRSGEAMRGGPPNGRFDAVSRRERVSAFASFDKCSHPLTTPLAAPALVPAE
jgi:hypothetical protein